MKIDAYDYGARGDGNSNDRAAIQAALNAAKPGDTVVLGWGSPGIYLVGNADATSCLNIPAGVTLNSDQPGVRLIAAPGIPGSARIIDINAPDVTVANLILDGNADNQPTPNEHMHGLMTRGARTTINGVTATRCCGDGLYAYNGAFDVQILNCLATLNQRNGITLSGRWDRGLLRGNKCIDNEAQQIDSEASVIRDLIMCLNGVSKAGATDHLVTVSGFDKDNRSSRWRIFDNKIDGGIHVAWADDIAIYGNESDNRSIRPCVSVYRTCKKVRIYGNDFVMNQTLDAATGVITVLGTTGEGPERVIIEDNDLTALGHAHSFGVRCEGAVSVQVMDNRIEGPAVNVAAVPGIPGSAGGAGVYARATSPDRRFESMLVIGNRIRDFGQFGVFIMGNGAAELGRLEVIGNVFDDGIGTMTTGVSLDPCIGNATIGPNVLMGGCHNELANAPGGRAALVPVNATILRTL